MVLNYIFHVSDIHIRHGDRKFCRYDEYAAVFDRLFVSICEQISELQITPEEFVIIVSGDIFHNKNIVGNYGLTLYKKFIQGLVEIGKTIVFHGNHDRNQNEIDQPSLVSSTIHINNLVLLDKSTSFTIDDVGFSYVSIDDTLDFYKTAGRIEDLPEFPSLDQNIKHKVALFHGTFAQVRLYNGREVTNDFRPYPFEWIEKFDFAILGDIHLRQKGNYDKKTLWGYSGSLVQQNYGEDIINHGYMIWNLNERKIKEVNVYNDIGYVNLKEENNTIMIRKRGNYIPFEDVVNEPNFPKNIEVKIYSEMDFTKLHKLLSKYDITARIASSKIPSLKCPHTEKHSNISDLENNNIIINKSTLIEHFQKHLSKEQHVLLSSIIKNNDKLLFDVQQYPIELREECHKKNKELSVFISHCCKSDEVLNERPAFLIKYLEWENLYCYEKNNHINFDETECNTFMIGGNNGTGKSAIYDIIALAVWGDITTCKQSTISNGVIHYRHSRAYTIIDVESGGIVYRIHRIFGKQVGKNTLVKSSIKLYQKTSDKYTLLKKDNSCTEVIKQLFGTLDEFLSSSMITQNVDFDLLKMNYKDCIAIIDKATNIDYIYNLYTLFKSSLNKYKDFRKIIESKSQVYEKLCHETDLSNNDQDLESNLKLLLQRKDSLNTQNNSLAIDVTDEKCIRVLETINDDSLDGISISDDEYSNVQKRLCELEYILKNKDVSEYPYESIDLYLPPIKPCELSYIQSEKDHLCTYACKDFDKYENCTKKELDEALGQSKTNYEIYCKELKILEKNKPVTIEQPPYYKKDVLDLIIKYYHNVDNMLFVCDKYCLYPINTEDHETITKYYSLDELYTKIEQVNILTQNIKKTKDLIEKTESIINEMYDKRSELENVEEADYHKSNSCTNIVYNDSMLSTIQDNDALLDTFYKNLTIVFELSNRIDQCKHELDDISEVCEYDPKCKYCCKQPWVVRMTTLKNTIAKNEKEINKFFDNNKVDYLTLYNKNSDLKYKRYQQFVQQRDHIEKTFKEHTIIRTEYLQKIEEYNKELENNLYFIDIFKKQSCYLLKCFNFNKYLNDYNAWSKEYENVENNTKEEEIILNQITKFQEYKPRKDKYKELESTYKFWETNNRSYISTMFRQKDQLETQKRVYDTNNMKLMRKNILKKQELINELKTIDCEIKCISNEITRYNTICSVHAKNYEDYKLLKQSIVDINNIIEVMEILIDKFKLYRKDIYQNIILKNLTEKANTYIDKICHDDTKRFELGYILTEVKDIIHINWLIKTKNEENLDQIVSVNQASGFQHFVISLALRMSLFGNKRCSQLFFDEGFTACDRLNLSIVPSFIKGLLQLFSSVVIVSHIDIIKESVDMVTTIEYDKRTKSSQIEFGKKIVNN
jgi:DNA repair exonuclease SbcCD ATPase subunit